MRYVDVNYQDLDQVADGRIRENETFSFRCHPEIACFNRCCRNLNLFLYPYDVLRLKHRLGLSSDAFLDRYTDVILRPEGYFPDVLLRMAANREASCPFLSNQGCRVYPDRPGTCRTFPVEQGSYHDASKGCDYPVYFFRPPDFCLGRRENQLWTAQRWFQDQEALDYTRMSTRWAEFKRRFQNDPWGVEGPSGRRAKMAFMATYNVDRFREFVFQSTFLNRFRITAALKEKIKTQDETLLELGMDWVELFLWGRRSRMIRLR